MIQCPQCFSMASVVLYLDTGCQLALRVDGDLYYTLSDPTGASLTLLDESGNEAGHVLYDPLGRVLTSTLTAKLTEALAGQGALADPATGLVHLGQGRFYDPALGRPLQPNPAGGPPSVPQALNRYAATSVGAPGVVEGAVNTGDCLANPLCGVPLNKTIGLGGDDLTLEVLSEAHWRLHGISNWGKTIEVTDYLTIGASLH